MKLNHNKYTITVHNLSKIQEVNLLAFPYKLLYKDFSSIDGNGRIIAKHDASTVCPGVEQ